MEWKFSLKQLQTIGSRFKNTSVVFVELNKY